MWFFFLLQNPGGHLLLQKPSLEISTCERLIKPNNSKRVIQNMAQLCANYVTGTMLEETILKRATAFLQSLLSGRIWRWRSEARACPQNRFCNCLKKHWLQRQDSILQEVKILQEVNPFVQLRLWSFAYNSIIFLFYILQKLKCFYTCSPWVRLYAGINSESTRVQGVNQTPHYPPYELRDSRDWLALLWLTVVRD